jgi:hypothetical protein
VKVQRVEQQHVAARAYGDACERTRKRVGQRAQPS